MIKCFHGLQSLGAKSICVRKIWLIEIRKKKLQKLLYELLLQRNKDAYCFAYIHSIEIVRNNRLLTNNKNHGRFVSWHLF